MTVGWVVAMPLALLFGMLACLEAGSRLALRAAAGDQPEGARAGLAAIEGAIFALCGLLLAFAFSGAASRFDLRRALVLSEANALGTAWLRVDLLPETAHPGVRDHLRRYVDARLVAYEERHQGHGELAELLQAANAPRAALWSASVEATRGGGPGPALFLQALNEAFDVADSRLAVTSFHPPVMVYVLLVGMGCLAALVAGWGLGASRSTRFHRVVFAGAVSCVVYVTMDLELPRSGLVRVDATDGLLRNLRASWR